MIPLPESPLERAKRLSRRLVDVDLLVGITERVPLHRDSDAAPRGREAAEAEGQQRGDAEGGNRPDTAGQPPQDRKDER